MEPSPWDLQGYRHAANYLYSERTGSCCRLGVCCCPYLGFTTTRDATEDQVWADGSSGNGWRDGSGRRGSIPIYPVLGYQEVPNKHLV